MAITIAINQVANNSGWTERNSISLYNELQARNFITVKIGRKHYLFTSNVVIDIGNYTDFWRGLCDYRILNFEDIVTGRELRELIRLCKRYAINLKQHLIQQGCDEELAALKKIRGKTDEQKRFLRSCVLRSSESQTHDEL